MPKKWTYAGHGPEGRSYFQEVKTPALKKGKTPPPPPNFLPQDLSKTFDQNNPPILTGAQGYSQAMEKKEE
jgi:hypothetical protein